MAEAISAGDIGRFSYCALNWKRSLEGQKGSQSRRGLEEHEALAHHVDALELYQTRARHSQDLALWLALFAASAAALGVEFLALRQATVWWWGLVFLSVLWAGASLYFVVFNLYYTSRAREVVRSRDFPEGLVVYADGSRHAPLLASRVVPLRGRPDVVMEREGQIVPVEYKSGPAPRGPYDSHVLQLAAYCYLVNENYGKRPTYGIVAYKDRQFEIQYTPDLEDRLLRTLLRIQLAERTGDVHRSHENPRRCAGCSRREGCPERLDVAA